MRLQTLAQIIAIVVAFLGMAILLRKVSLPKETRTLLAEIERREDIEPRSQLASLGLENHVVDRLESEWNFIANSFRISPHKIRLDDSVYLLCKFDSLGGDASLEMDVRLNLDKPLDESCTVRDLLFLLDAISNRDSHL